ncbi:MAG: TIM barrel protein, partial [Verrucomicrobiota bacterium]
MYHRRNFLKQLSFAALATTLPRQWLQANTGSDPIPLGYSTFPFYKKPGEEAIRAIAEMGYDSIEIATTWNRPKNLDAEARKRIREALLQYKMPLPKLFDRIPVLDEKGKTLKDSLELIRLNAQLGHDVNASVGGIKPCIGTRLGSNSRDWEANKNLIVDRLHEWEKVAKEMDTIIAIKGHVNQLSDSSEKTFWLVDQIQSPWIRVEYCYGHFQVLGEEWRKSLELLLPLTAVITLQDWKKKPDGSGYIHGIPGDGDVDYVEYYKYLLQSAYKGHTIVWMDAGKEMEQPDYDPLVIARHC